MPDPATDPDHDLGEQPQDPDAVDPRVPVASLVPLVRVLAGRRGHASITWHRHGFAHTLSVVRTTDDPGLVQIDRDPDVDLTQIRDALHEHLIEPG